jgi:hypothetical protein
MNDNELATALGTLISKAVPQSPDPRALALEVLRRDRQRFRLLAGLSVLFWLLGLAGLVLLLVGLHRFVISVRIAGFFPPGDLEGIRIHGTSLLHHSIPVIGGSIGALLLAALCTILLISSSRTATLNQISISLMELSEQLRQMRQASAGERAPKPGEP